MKLFKYILIGAMGGLVLTCDCDDDEPADNDTAAITIVK
jgi:hypothetical protein